MRKLASIVLIAAAFLLIAACSSKPQATPLSYVNAVDSTDLSKEKGGSIALGITEKSLVEQLGKPERTLNQGNMDFLIMYEDYQYTSRDDRIIGYSFGPKPKRRSTLRLATAPRM